MNRSQAAGSGLSTSTAKRTSAVEDDGPPWMGGEASVGTQARQYLRRREKSASGLALTILGLTFLGGLAAGGLLNVFLQHPRR